MIEAKTMKDNCENRENRILVMNPNRFRTPPRKTKPLLVRRRINGSPLLSRSLDLPVKTVYMIRHGESKGQAAQHLGLDRRTDPSLRDCDLTERGKAQAVMLSKLFEQEQIQLVLSSPLTRALHTSLLAFANKDILVHYNLREIGSKAPENVPRDMNAVLRDLRVPLSLRDENLMLDIATYKPFDWPRDYSPSVVKKDRVLQVFKWLYKEREEMSIAVVCHCNVIRAAVQDGEKLKPKNAEPIRCHLYSNGELVLVDT